MKIYELLSLQLVLYLEVLVVECFRTCLNYSLYTSFSKEMAFVLLVALVVVTRNIFKNQI